MSQESLAIILVAIGYFIAGFQIGRLTNNKGGKK